jgi:hypothetical protein
MMAVMVHAVDLTSTVNEVSFSQVMANEFESRPADSEEHPQARAPHAGPSQSDQVPSALP